MKKKEYAMPILKTILFVEGESIMASSEQPKAIVSDEQPITSGHVDAKPYTTSSVWGDED